MTNHNAINRSPRTLDEAICSLNQACEEIDRLKRSSDLLLEKTPNMLFLFDSELRLTLCSEACAPLLQAGDSEKLKGLPLCKVFSPDIDREWVNKLDSHSRSCLETRDSFHYEDTLHLPEGRLLHIQVDISAVMGDSSDCNGVILSLHDITELILVRQQAEESSRSKSNFLANMSHEIRTPMNAVKGLSELLALTELTNTQRNYVQNIIGSSNTLLGIINDVLDFSKIDANKAELIEGSYSLGDLIGEICNVVSLRASEKGLLLFIQASPTLPRTLKGDDVRAKQIIVNILSNAVKYTPAGHVTLRVYGEKRECGIDLICSVEDTGVGIHEEDIPRIFEAFSRADLKANRNILGTGLGLSITRKLVEIMGGSITVESEFGLGSTFTVRIPQGIVDPRPLACVENPDEKHVLLLENAVNLKMTSQMLDELSVPHTAILSIGQLDQLDRTAGQYTHCIFDDSFPESYIRRLRSQIAGCIFIMLKDMRYAMAQTDVYESALFLPLLTTELAKALMMKHGQQFQAQASHNRDIDEFALKDTHILAVDDNEINLMVCCEILNTYKANVTCAESGAEAIKLCETNKYDLIFMDHMMPEMDGVETTRLIRKLRGPNQATPIVALTANVLSGMSGYYIQCGMNDFVAKPIEISELSQVLLHWLPKEKITTLETALCPDSGEDRQPHAETMQTLILAMDAFGMYVSDVMRELNGNNEIYVERMERILYDLAPLVLKLRAEVAAEDWASFAEDIEEMGQMIHDVGARECSGRARKLANAARNKNANYIRGDFFSLMDNMYMLEKKMEVAVPLARGQIRSDVPFGDPQYCRDCLNEMRGALINHDMNNSDRLMESLANYSLDHDLDMILNAIRAKLAEGDFEGAMPLHDQALHHCTLSIENKKTKENGEES